MSGRDSDEGPESRWAEGTGVRGVVPPGRRLDGQRKAGRWSASGVKGVALPHRAKPSAKPSWLEKPGQKRVQPKISARSRSTRSPARLAEVFSDEFDPNSLAELLDQLRSFIEARSYEDEASERFSEIIIESRAPFEIIVAFTVLNGLIGSSKSRRRYFGPSLERGVKVYYNLALRLNPAVEVPPQVSTQPLDALFFDLADMALEVPYAYTADALAKVIDQLEFPLSQETIDFCKSMRERFIERRVFADQALRQVFPGPDWMQASD